MHNGTYLLIAKTQFKQITGKNFQNNGYLLVTNVVTLLVRFFQIFLGIFPLQK